MSIVSAYINIRKSDYKYNRQLQYGTKPHWSRTSFYPESGLTTVLQGMRTKFFFFNVHFVWLKQLLKANIYGYHKNRFIEFGSTLYSHIN